MIFKELTQDAQLNGIFTLIAIAFIIPFGIITLIKAIKTKEKILYPFFLCIMTIFAGWYPGALGYLYWLITNDFLSYEVYVLVGPILMPITTASWLYIYLYVVHSKKYLIFLYIFIIGSLIWLLIFLYYLFFAPNAPVETYLTIVDQENLDTTYSSFVLFYLLTCLIIALITGFHFSINGMRSSNITTKLKSKFVLIGFISYISSAILDSITNFPVIVIIARLLLIITSICFYIGFIMPSWAKKILSIED